MIVRWPWARRGVDDFSEEVESHIEMEADRLVRERGIHASTARAMAIKTFGNRTAAAERYYESRRSLWFDTVRRDAAYALRTLRKTPVFAVVVVATLSVGIASVTTVFSFINGVFFRALPYRDVSHLVALTESRDRSWTFSRISWAAVGEIRRGTRVFDGIAVYRDAQSVLASGGDPTFLRSVAADGTLMPLLGIRTERGRVFAPDDYQDGAAPILVSDELWRRRFNADEHLVGSTIRVDREWRTVIGIVAPGQRFPTLTDLWVPLIPSANPDSSLAPELSAVAHLRRGTSWSTAQAQLAQLAKSLATTDPARFKGEILAVEPGLVEFRGMNPFSDPDVWEVAGMFIVGAVCVLLIVCANVGALLLVRGADRGREMAIRGALGGSRRRLVQQNLTESAILALGAGAIGVVLTALGVKAVTFTLPLDHLPDYMRFGVDPHVLVFTMAVAVFVTIAFGLAPARVATRLDLVRALKAGGDTAVAGGTTRGARNRVIVELALAFPLVVAAAGAWGTYHRLANVDLGYARDRILVGSIELDERQYGDARAALRFGDAAAAALAASPAVEAAAFSSQFHSWRTDTSRDWTGGEVYLSSDLVNPIKVPDYIGEQVVSEGYLRTMGLALREGRWFSRSDDSSNAAVVVVSEGLAKRITPSGHVTGQLLRLGKTQRPVTVIGVVSKVLGITESAAGGWASATMAHTMYFSDRQALGTDFIEILGRSRSRAGALMKAFPAAVHSVDPDVAADFIRPMEFDADTSLLLLRVMGGVMAAFALAALFLAVLGTYGVIAYDLARRTREIGVRIALGGSTEAIIRMIVWRGLRFVAVGLFLGAGLTVMTTRLVGSLVFGYVAANAAETAGVLALFSVVGLAACYLPARRVTRADPITALRAE